VIELSLQRNCPPISGLSPQEMSEMKAKFSEYDLIRQIERYGILKFMESHEGFLIGRVLDFGAGKSPYRNCVRGEYVPYHEGEVLPQGPFDAIMCNQVTQYLTDIRSTFSHFHNLLNRTRGFLVMTFATNWDEVEDTDIVRYTKSGMSQLLLSAGFSIIKMELRSQVRFGSFKFPLGYGVVARKS
jgi:hypothetical protein